MPQVVPFLAGAFGFGTGAAWAGAAATAFAAGTTFAGTVLGGLTVKLLTSVAITALQSALMTDNSRGGGITISTTLRGEDNPETIILGRYATAGQCVYVNSHGSSRRYLTHVVELCSAPGATLNRLMLGDQWVTLAETPMAGYEQYGLPVTSEDYAGGYVFVKYYNGSQTTADASLVANYGADPDRPWAATAIGTGICYAILTFYHHAEILPQIPPYRFELDGIPLYDIRKDSTQGGSGSQRLGNPATWTQTDNPGVMIWNVMRGVPLPGGEIWGGGFDLAAIPTDVFTTAMNRCDVTVATGAGLEPSYRAALEVALTQEPAATVTELLKACSATIADMGYAWTIAVAAPALPVYAVTDDDLIVSKSQTLDPFPSLADTYNAVSARYPSPGHLWESHEAPLRKDAALEASDVFGRRTASLSLPAAPYGRQVQRLQLGWLNDNRRFTRHIVNVPPDAAALDLSDTLDWTSVRNGYSDKTFSIYEIAEDVRTCIRQVSLRERNPADYDWDSSAELPMPPVTVVSPKAAEGVSGFSVAAATVVDASGNARRAAIQITWNPEIAARGLRWELRLNGQTTVRQRGDTQRISDGSETLISGILPDTAYLIRARLIARRKTVWTSWMSVTTLPVRFGSDDMSTEFLDQMEATAELAGIKPVSVLPATGDKVDQIVMLVPPGRLYRWTGTAWSMNLFAGVEAGSLDIAAFAASIRPPELFAALPTTGNSDGRTVYRTSDNTMWQRRAGAWVNLNAAELIVGQLVAGQIAAGAIGAKQIAAQAILASKLAIGDTSNMFPDPLLVDFPNGWTFTTSADYNAGVSTVSDNALAISPSKKKIDMAVGGVASTGGANSPPFSIEAGKAHWVSLCLGAYNNAGITANCTTRLYVRWYSDTDGSALLTSSLVGETSQTHSVLTTPTSGIVIAPEDARSARLYAQRIGDAAADAFSFSGPVVRRANAGELTVDGSVKANHLAVETLLTDSAQIAAAIINTAHIANASMTTAKIADLAVTTAKIAALAVDTAQLANAAINSAKIANLAVTGAKIADLTVGTLKITDDAVTNGVGANKSSLTSSGATTSSRDITINCLAGSKVAVLARADATILEGATTSCILRIKWNGTTIASYTGATALELDEMIMVTAVAGTNTLRFEYVSTTAYPWKRAFGPAMLLEMKK